MSKVAVKGWCPGVWQPMQSGDGLVVRIRPRQGRIDAKQAAGIAELSERYGNGLIDLTNRANLQIRGLREDNHSPLIDGLAKLRLLDPDPDTEARRNVLIAPFWDAGDEVITIANELERALVNGPSGLPAKFGFAIDCGKERVLSSASADVRIERDIEGQLIVRADGAELGRAVSRNEAATAALGVAEWFVFSGGAKMGRGRMATHLAAGAKLPETLCGRARPGPRRDTPDPGRTPHGALFGAAFGQLTSAALKWLAGNAKALRVTPWRMMLAEGMNEMPACEGLITHADDSLLRVVACSGAPRCHEAHADTRSLAAALAPHLAADTRLHVSGCVKGCAQSFPASITLVATDRGFDLIRDGSVRDAPALRGLSADRILADPSVLLGGR
jgi:precorrin-3B synthase